MSTEPHPEGSAIRRVVQVRNRLGVHARPANLIVRTAMKFAAKVEIAKGNELVDAKSMLSLLTLGAEQGSELIILADGDDAEAAVAEIGDLFDRGFDEEEEPAS
jgi:phosphocarrier protein HPr